MFPQWNYDMEDVLEAPLLALSGQQFDIMLDASEPMGGYMHEDPDSTHFHEIVTQLITEMDVKFGDPRCTRVDNSLKPMSCDVRDIALDGTESDINTALDSLIVRLRSGRIESAALITDLMGAASYGHTPVTLMSSLGALFPEINAGSVQLALMGIRLDYWGVRKSSCRGPGTWGCWLHEGNNEWTRLPTVVAQRPLYVLFFERSNAEKSSLVEMMYSLEESIRTLDDDIEVHTEFFTGPTSPEELEITWVNNRDANEDLEFNDVFYNECEEIYMCKDDDQDDVEFVLRGVFTDSLDHSLRFEPDDLMLEPAEWVRGEIIKSLESLEVTVNCSKTDTSLQEQVAMLALKTKPQSDNNLASGLDSWSSVQESPNSTIDLSLFLESLRPDYYEGTDSTFIRMQYGR